MWKKLDDHIYLIEKGIFIRTEDDGSQLILHPAMKHGKKGAKIGYMLIQHKQQDDFTVLATQWSRTGWSWISPEVRRDRRLYMLLYNILLFCRYEPFKGQRQEEEPVQA